MCDECVECIEDEENLRDYLSARNEIDFLKSLIPTITSDAILSAFSDMISVTVTVVAVVHLVVTVLTLYGIYACRPEYIRPMVADAATSLILLLAFVLHSLYSCWRANHLAQTSAQTSSDRFLRNVYIGAAFLLTYFIWLSITLAAYFDVLKLRADFMYWIVEERASLSVHQNTAAYPTSSAGQKSERSSRSSRASRTSRTSRYSQNMEPSYHPTANIV
ncbi:unnamed protein product [Toxocara canis]|uniref:MARVEL domain-containing protein n=1 Tax=Toxocara canis TaxID=6265 RepID=A0A183UDQ9_TOXCA|nr:unnamed protein product [Toxocara canis]